jgi:cytochrome c-type biogenesis protein CcmE
VNAPTKKTPRFGAIAAVAVLLAAFAWLIWGNLDKNVVFFLTPQELLAKGTDGMNVPIRLGGQVKPGSVKWDEKALDLRFDVVDTDGKSTVHVKSKGAPPQMFRDGMGVVVEGRFGADSVFMSTMLMVKHSNEYRAPKAGERPQEMYKSLMKGSGT